MIGLYASLVVGVVLLLGAVLRPACAPLAYEGRHRTVVQRAASPSPSTLSPAYTGGSR